MKNEPKIDIVYLWVDSSDPKWRAEKNKWLEIIKGQKPLNNDATTEARWRDNGELKHSLRSVAECAPWVNHIYIITSFNQVPKWLNTDNPKITIVPHEQIFPADALPTFNSSSIEMCIPNIPNLSEHFLLMNDDMFLNRPLPKSYFFDKRGRALVRFSKRSNHQKISEQKSSLSEYDQRLITSAEYIEQVFGKKLYKYRPSHGIDPYLKSSLLECHNNKIISPKIKELIYCKFRTHTSIQRWIFNLYDLATGRAKFIHSRAYKFTKHKILNLIYNKIFFFQIRNSAVYCTNTTAARAAISQAPQFCINDTINTDDKTLVANAKFMAERFPNKCEFEK